MNGEVTRDLKGQVYEIQVICRLLEILTLYFSSLCLLPYYMKIFIIFYLIHPQIILPHFLFSVIFQLIEDDTWYSKDKLREIIHQAIIVVKKNYDQTSEKYLKLVDIPLKVSDYYHYLSDL